MAQSYSVAGKGVLKGAGGGVVGLAVVADDAYAGGEEEEEVEGDRGGERA